jgi:hypothetical protein
MELFYPPLPVEVQHYLSPFLSMPDPLTQLEQSWCHHPLTGWTLLQLQLSLHGILTQDHIQDHIQDQIACPR